MITDAFALVRKIGLSLPGVEAVTRYDGAEVLKAGGVFVAAIASHESADADSLVMRCEIDDRELMIEDAPETYYVTDYEHYHLRRPERGYRYVRDDDGQIFLTAVATGLIVDIVVNGR